MAISQELQEIYAGSSVARYIETIELHHPSFAAPGGSHYLHNDSTHQTWQFLSESGASLTFESCPFAIQLPSSNQGMLQDLNVAIANVGAPIMLELDRASQVASVPIDCIYRVYLDKPNRKPEIDPPLRLTISTINVDMEVVSATAERYDVLNKPFPLRRYRGEEWPGLVR